MPETFPSSCMCIFDRCVRFLGFLWKEMFQLSPADEVSVEAASYLDVTLVSRGPDHLGGNPATF